MNPLTILKLLPAALLAVSVGGNWAQYKMLQHKQAELVEERLIRAACDARVLNILEDKESDDAVDNLTDDDLRNVPDHWLLP
jgi:hypothetical protein